tara:strand:- start:251 stop:1432 length:1182 start_codon:yes stop_codon:yes gene_type:complete
MSFARGFIKGFVGQSLDNKAAADQRLGEFTDRISVDYLNNKLPAFMENEKKMEKRYTLIEKNMGKNAALYASAQGLTDTDAGMNMILGLKDIERISFLDAVNKIDFKNFNRDINAQTRAADFNERHSTTTDYLKKIQGGLPTSVSDLMIPKASGDMAQSQFDTSTLQPLDTMIGSTTGNVYNIMNARHATEANRISNDFDKNFYNRNLGQYVITGLGKDNPVYPLLTNLLSDYDDAEKRGYTGGKLQYIRDKFINQKLNELGITNYPRAGYDNLPEAKTVAKTISSNIPGASEQTESLIAKSKTKKIDPEKVPGKKFDTSKSPGKKYDPEKSPGIRVTSESGAIMNEAREIRAKIARSTALSDEEKEQKLAELRENVRKDLEAAGLDPDNFSI